MLIQWNRRIHGKLRFALKIFQNMERELALHEYLSEVIVKVSGTPEGKFKGHIFADGDHIVTVGNKNRDTAISQALNEAKSILKTDNVSE